MKARFLRPVPYLLLALAAGAAGAAGRVPGTLPPQRLPAAPGADVLLLTFEAPAFQPGELAGQQGWTTEWEGTDWTIGAAHPYAGSQHLRALVRFEGFSSSAFGPTLMGVGQGAYSIAATRIAVDNRGVGSAVIFSPLSAASNNYNPAGPAQVGRVRVRGDGSIDVLQPGQGFVATGAVIPDKAYHEIKVVADNRGAGTIEVCLDGANIFTGVNGAAPAPVTYIDTLYLQSAMPDGSLGSTADFDDMRITDAERGGCAGPDAWNFDGVTAPALPEGWSSDTAAAGTAWVTEAAGADSAPNVAHAVEQASPAEASLVSASASVGPAGARLSFRHRWNTENDYDGGVLEIAIGGGAFADIVSAGGSFVAAGYNGNLTDASNPLGVRPAWSGLQQDFVTTTVELPPAAAGQPVRLRWRLGSDGSLAATAPNGWWVDSVVLADNAIPTEPAAVIAPQSLSLDLAQGATATDTLTIANAGGGTLTYSLPGLADATAGRPYAAPAPRAASGPRAFSAGHGVAPGLRGATPREGGGILVSQMADNTPVAPNAMSCGQPDTSTDQNSWWRRFYFSEHSRIGRSAVISAVTVGSESGPQIPATINVYTTPHEDEQESIALDRLTLIGSGSGLVGGVLGNTLIALNATVDDTVAKDLVVEYRIEGSDDGEFFPGGNPSAQAHPTYVSAPACGAPAPVDAALVGFPDFHLVMQVHVQETPLPAQCTDLSGLAWLSATPATGAVGFGGSAAVSLGVDAATLSPGLHESTLCVATNDAGQPFVSVPLRVQVTPRADAIFADGFQAD